MKTYISTVKALIRSGSKYKAHQCTCSPYSLACRICSTRAMHHIFRLVSNPSRIFIDHPLTAWSDGGEVKQRKGKAPTRRREEKVKMENMHFSNPVYGCRAKQRQTAKRNNQLNSSILTSLLALRLHRLCLSPSLSFFSLSVS